MTTLDRSRAVTPPLTRRTVLGWAAGASGGLLAAACGAATSAPPASQAAVPTGTFDFMGPSEQPVWGIDDALINAFQEKNPGIKVNHIGVAGGIMVTIPEKIQAMAAAGSGADGYLHYGESWRGVDASTVMAPLTPQIFKRGELEKTLQAHLLETVWSKKKEVFILPALAAVASSLLVSNGRLLANAGVDAKQFKTWDDILAGAGKLTARDGGAIVNAGLAFDTPHIVLRNFILDNGGQFYDEKSGKWNWLSSEAERGLQWVLDTYDKHRVVWRDKPPGVKDGMGEGRIAMTTDGAHSLSTRLASYPDIDWQERPLPAFVPGKQPVYWIRRIAGYSLAPWLKPDDVKTKIGAALYRFALSLDGAMIIADNYTGAILIKGTYADPRFKQTKYGSARTWLENDVIAKTVTITTAAVPDAEEAAIVNKAIMREVSVKAALAELQQLFTTEEEKAQRNRR